MSNRMPSRAALLFLITALTASTVNVAAVEGGWPAARERSKAQAARMNEGAQKGAIYDEAGRAVKTTVTTSEKEKVTVTLKYDGRNRIRSVILDDGMQIELVYDTAGMWQGFSFQDGGKLLFKRNASGEIVGATRVAKSVSQHAPGARRVGVRRVGFVAPRVDECASATATAVAAAASAVATCMSGLSVQCATSMAVAAIAAVKAYDACKDTGPAAEESAA